MVVLNSSQNPKKYNRVASLTLIVLKDSSKFKKTSKLNEYISLPTTVFFLREPTTELKSQICNLSLYQSTVMHQKLRTLGNYYYLF